jgi:hypothetical protein
MRTENVSAIVPTTIWWDEEVVTPLPRTVAEWRSIVMDAYVTMPTLSLTAPQAQRLWAMDARTAVYVLDSLVTGGLLTRANGDQYRRVDYAGPLDTSFGV